MACNDREPPREVLAPEVEYAARVIHREVWGSPYRKGEGPMHFAGGSYWSSELRRRAAHWEYLAEAARTCADALPGEQNQRVSGLGVCSKCDDHNKLCVCRVGCTCPLGHAMSEEQK